MIDFVSTRETTDTQSAACARLLAAVIARAIEDAKTPFSEKEKLEKKNISHHASAAIKFLFKEPSVFPLYASLIGTSAEAIRTALLEPSTEMSKQSRQYGEMDRRIVARRLRWSRMSGMRQ